MVTKKSDKAAETPTATPVESAVLSPVEQLMQLTQTGLPSVVGDALGQVLGQNGGYDDNLGDDDNGLRMAFAALPQKEGKYRGDKRGQIFIGNRDDDPQSEDGYSREVEILWVDFLGTRSGTGRNGVTGGRMMWQHAEDGQRDLENGLGCQSLDGVAPMPRYIGNELPDFRTGRPFKIGFSRNPTSGQFEPIADGGICARCPAAQWIKVGERSVQLCKSNWAWVVYDVANDRLVKVSGSNSGIQMALEGRQKDAMGAKRDGSPLPGIEYFFKSTGTRKLVVAVVDGATTLTASQLPFVTGISPDDEGKEVAPVTALLPTGEPHPGYAAALASGQVKSVVLDIPVFPYAPEGRPEHTGNPDSPVYPVVMTAVPNNFKLKSQANPTSVPDFRVGEDPLTKDQYAAYLRVRADYHEAGMRDVLLGTGMRERVLERLTAATPLTISVERPAALPGGDQVVEGSFTVEATVPLDE
ncbi:hypothetical protein Rctr85_076 [Virus Rctr85]|nr:hypothetical protein Rctr85_076 [Virus Rctr85]